MPPHRKIGSIFFSQIGQLSQYFLEKNQAIFITNMPVFLHRFYFLLADIRSNHSFRIKHSDTFIYGGGSRRHGREVLKRDVQTDNFTSFIGAGKANFFFGVHFKHCS